MANEIVDVESRELVNQQDQSSSECEAIVLRAMRDLAAGRTVDEVESIMLQQEQAQAPVIHRFGPGIYIREVSIPAGTLAIGHAQRLEHLNVMLKGRVTIFHEDGSTSELVAPMVFVGKPGRKVGYIHEDMVWQNIYATSETDVARLEEMFLEKSDVWNADQALRIADSIKIEEDRRDYHAMLAEFGIPDEVAVAQSANTKDQTPFPHGGYKVMVAKSPIHGNGLFATADIEPEELIAPARIGGMRTPAGSKTNHSARPNAKFVMRDNGDIDLVATQSIAGCRGGQAGQEITVDYRQALALSGLRSITCQG